MQENEFEKQVKQTMDGFNLRPSDAVWADVERRIRKEKKRRRAFWWPLLLVLLLGGGTVTAILLNRSSDKSGSGQNGHTAAVEKKDQNQSVTFNNNTPASPAASETTRPEEAKPVAEAKATTAGMKPAEQPLPIEKRDAATPAGQREAVTVGRGEMTFVSAGKGGKAKRRAAGNQPVPPQLEENPPVNVQNQAVAAIPPVVTTQPVVPDSAAAAVFAHAGQQPVATDANKPVQSQATPVQPPVKKDSVATVAASKPKEKTPEKWKTEISISVGRSSLTDRIGFGAFKASSLAYADANLAGGPPPPPQAANPSLLYSGMSWSVHVHKKKEITPRLTLSLGVGYQYLSTRMITGSRIDSSGVSGGRIYQLGNSTQGKKNYTNQYHLLMASADLYWRLINKDKFKLDWKNSLQAGYLFSSNMLHYNSSARLYYQDNSLLLKPQVFFSTGFSVPVKSWLRAETYLNYAITPMLRNNTASLHYADVGIRLGFLLNKKKKTQR